MKRPEKKKIDRSKPEFINNNEEAIYGYNQCKKEFDEYLPSKKEIEEIIYFEYDKYGTSQETMGNPTKKVAQAIFKRIME